MRALCAILGVLVLAYLYFVCASVLNIMARKEAASRVSSIQTAISQLERDYFALNDSLTPESGAVLGLAPVEGTAYVYRPGNAAAAETADTIQRNAI